MFIIVILEQVSNFKYLGVTLDVEMNFDIHLKYIIKKISARIGVLGRVRKYLPLKHRVMVYNSLILPHFDYVSTIWSNTYAKHTDPLVALQGRAGRVIIGAPKLTPTDSVLRGLKWTPMPVRWQCQRAVMMFRVARGRVPGYLSSGFDSLEESYSNTDRVTRGRSHGHFRPSPAGTEWGRRRLITHGAFLWNHLPPDVTTLVKLSHFNRALKNLVKTNYKFYTP